jgi:hypothetical protein
MPENKAITPARERILLHWNRSISDALSRHDRRYLRFLRDTISTTAETFDGAAKARALAALARCEAARRFLGGRRHV